MKIRTGFVTNSSSTSYLFAFKEKPDEATFLEECGIQKGSKAESLFKVLFRNIDYYAEPVETVCMQWSKHKDYANLDQFILSKFSPGVLDRIKQMEDEGFTVLMGSWSSDDDPVIAFFCTEHFVVDNDKFFLHAMNCAW